MRATSVWAFTLLMVACGRTPEPSQPPSDPSHAAASAAEPTTAPAVTPSEPTPDEVAVPTTPNLALDHVYTDSADGLRTLLGDLLAAAHDGRDDRLGVLAAGLQTSRESLEAVLSATGIDVIQPYLAANAHLSRNQFMARVHRWGTITRVRAVSATGAEIAMHARASIALNPEMRFMGPMLRPESRWYRVTLFRGEDTPPLLEESFVYDGHRWMFVPEPWRFLPGRPDRGAHPTFPPEDPPPMQPPSQPLRPPPPSAPAPPPAG